MLTRIEIDGFKMFKDFKVDLAPFQVIVGPNSSGKSNFFDALQLLSRLAETDLYSACLGARGGDTGELFTRYPDGSSSNHIKFAVEMLVDRQVVDDFGRKANLQYNRLRYELEITQIKDEVAPDRLFVSYESLRSIPREEDSWSDKYGLSAQNDWLSNETDEKTFISTEETFEGAPEVDKHPSATPITIIHSDGKGSEAFAQFTEPGMEEPERTTLSVSMGAFYPHILAVHKELQAFRFLHLDPEALRQLGPTNAPRLLSSDGSNLATVLGRMQAEDKYVLGDISLDLASLIPGIRKIRIEKNRTIDKYIIQVKTTDKRTFSSQVLSDGTLRLLALATLKNDAKLRGLLCIEEPENSVEPLHIENMARLLRKMATDFSDPEQADKPLRQVFITTHSPVFVGLPETLDALLFTLKVNRVGPGTEALQVTRMIPILSPNNLPISNEGEGRDISAEVYSIDQIRKYLSSDNVAESRDLLEKTRSSLINER